MSLKTFFQTLKSEALRTVRRIENDLLGRYISYNKIVHLVLTIQKGRGAIDLSTGSYISLGLLGRGWRGKRNSSGEGRKGDKWVGFAHLPQQVRPKYHHD